ncbi:hypothetical protein [Burkholderia anthina]|uniref:hypothetical protein n=1 Tax=Burkholderia anthina TaxID=179879 RepID=UPI00158CCECE|nr:hypothetical protein [Burkholderia anthina]
MIPVTDAPVVVDGGFITCPGGLAGINLAMLLVDQHCGKTRSHKALHYLMADCGFEEARAVTTDIETRPSAFQAALQLTVVCQGRCLRSIGSCRRQGEHDPDSPSSENLQPSIRIGNRLVWLIGRAPRINKLPVIGRESSP